MLPQWVVAALCHNFLVSFDLLENRSVMRAYVIKSVFQSLLDERLSSQSASLQACIEAF